MRALKKIYDADSLYCVIREQMLEAYLRSPLRRLRVGRASLWWLKAVETVLSVFMRGERKPGSLDTLRMRFLLRNQ